MGKPSKELMAFMSLHNVDASDVWEVRTGGAWAIKHSALERVAADRGITFEPPTIIEAKLADKIVAMCVTARMGDRAEWSIGEASPANCKNSYFYAMAEKRAKDRCVLKLLNTHGAVYSEAEAEDFAPPRQNPHVTRPSDILPTTEYDEQGAPIDNIPHGDDSIERMPKSKAREDFTKCQTELRASQTVMQLEKWGKANANRIASFPADWAEMMRGLYSEHMNDLRASLKAAQ